MGGYDNISGKINIPGVKNIQVDKDVKNHGTWYSQDVEKTMPDGTKKVANLKSVSIWHAAYYTPIENLKLKSSGEVINWNLPKDYANDLISGELKSFKGVLSLQDSGRGEAPGQQVSGHKEDTKKSLAQYESMSKKDLRKELEQKFGYNEKYDKMSKRELISALSGVPKEQVHASGNDPKKPDKQAEPKGKSLDQYEKMSKGDLRKELEKKTGEKGKYDKLSTRELISALTGTPKDQIHVAKDKDKKDQSKDLDQYENLSKKELRKELEKKTGKSDKFDKMSKRELVSALTGIPKDKVDLDKKEKDQTKKKDDDRQKKDGGVGTKLSKAQMEEIWKARPDVEQNVHAKKKGDPYEKTQTWWENYGRKEMGNYQFAGSTPAATPPATAASPAPAPSPPTPSPIKKLSKAQAEEIWKARPDVNENVHAKKKGDPYEKTQTWWENYGRKEMGNYQFAGTVATPPATAASATPSPSTPTPIPITKLSKAQAEEIWKARPDVEQNVHAKKKGDPYEKTQTWWENYGRKEMGNYQFAGTSPPAVPVATPPTGPPAKIPETKLSKAQAELEEKRRKQEEGRAEQERQKQAKLEEQRRRDEAKRFQEAKNREEQAKTGEKLKAQQEERRRQEAQRRVEKERQHQVKADEQRRREEQQHRAREQAQQRQAQMEQQRRAEDQRRQEAEQRQRAQQEQLRRQQEQQQRAQMEQHRRMQVEQQQRLQQEEARRRQTQMQQQHNMLQQQRIHQSPLPPPGKQQQQQTQKQKKQQ